MVNKLIEGVTLCRVYYKAKELALQNGRTYHVAAILKRGKRTVKIGANVDKTHPKFERTYKDGSKAAHMHAEMNVLRFAQPGDTLEVIRFSKCDAHPTMAKPCAMCIAYIKEAGIKRVKYTNWNGNWEVLEL
tara:strand:- start:533 stop:928 length:396 start_codon:yes stop_codon:yes gene_type:complete